MPARSHAPHPLLPERFSDLLGEPVIFELGIDGYRHLHVPAVGSTNDLCLDKVRQGDPGKLWVTTDNQTKGKGSRGRGWETGSGNLFASMICFPGAGKDPRILSGLAFVASLALAKAIMAVPGVTAPKVSLKWPNDVLLSGKKCAGILLESHRLEAGQAVIFGFGVNCVWHPAQTNHPATNFAEQGIIVSASEFFPLLAVALARQLAHWDKGNGFQKILDEWRNMASGIGESVQISLPNQVELTGKFRAIDNDGHFVLACDDGTEKRLSAGDIFFN